MVSALLSVFNVIVIIGGIVIVSIVVCLLVKLILDLTQNLVDRIKQYRIDKQLMKELPKKLSNINEQLLSLTTKYTLVLGDVAELATRVANIEKKRTSKNKPKRKKK